MALVRWWSRRSLYAKGSVVVAVPLAAMLLLVPWFVGALRTASARAADERRAAATSQAAETILKDLLDAETGVRGFLLAEDRAFLEPYRDALARFPGDRAALFRAVEADRGTDLSELDALADQRLGLLSRFVQDPEEADAESLERGRRFMDEIRAITGRLRDRAETARLEADRDRRAAEQRAQVAALIVIPAAVVAGALALLLFAHGIGARVRRNTENAERLAAGEPLLDAPEGHDEIGRSGNALVVAGQLLREQAAAIQRSEGELHAILENLREGVALLDANGAVVRFNRAGDEIAGFELRMRDEEAWRSRFELSRAEDGHPLDLDELPSRRAARGLATAPSILRLHDRDTDLAKWVLAYGAPVLDGDGVVLGGVSVLSDVTERVAADAKLEEARAAVERSNEELRQAQERLEALALTDALTGLLNRYGFEPLARQQLELAKRSGDDVSVLFFDVDGLKDVNDRLGHAVGSELLVDAADAIRSAVRSSDLCVRLGGDEFGVVVTGGPAAVAEVSDRVAANVEAANARPGIPYRLAMSVGSATSTADRPRSLEELLEEADERMYEHKRTRRAQRASV